MKKIFLMLFCIILTSCNFNRNLVDNISARSIKNSNYKLLNIDFEKMDPSFFVYSAYTCEHENEKCKIYFLPPFYNKYVLIYDNELNNNIHVNNYEIDYDNKLFNNFKMKIIENKIYIDENLKLLKKIRPNIVDLEKFNGEFEFNDAKYEIYHINSLSLNSLSLDSLDREFIRGNSSITILDNNILVTMDSIFSEYPIYKYSFDREDNLILEPLIGNYMYIDRIKYKLKRQN